MREGLREKKRRETKLRIAESALNLFIVNGFEATTLDEIAKEAAISRRTFFSYFKSKDERALVILRAGCLGVAVGFCRTV